MVICHGMTLISISLVTGLSDAFYRLKILTAKQRSAVYKELAHLLEHCYVNLKHQSVFQEF